MKINGKPDGGGGGGVITGLSISANGIYIATGGVDGYSPVEVSVQPRVERLVADEVTTYIASEYELDGFSQVDVKTGKGTFNNPYTVGEANAIIEAAAPSDTEPMYVSGKIVSVTSSYTQGGNYGNATFIIEDDYNNQITAYRLRYINNTKYNEVPRISTKRDVQVNDEVIIYGIFKKYNTSYQTKAGDAYLYLLNGTGLVPDPDWELDITSNGDYNVAYWGSALVNVQPVTESLSVSINGTYTPGVGVDGYSQVVVDVPQSVAGFTEEEITMETYAIYNLSNSASFVHRNVFEGDDNLLTVNLPNASYVGSEAFKLCKNLTDVNLPTCTLIWESAFHFCSHLSYISAPLFNDCTSAVFMSCYALTNVDFPALTNLADRLFADCYSLSAVSLPVCKYVGREAFSRCGLNQIYLPMTIAISENAFYSCPSLTTVNLPLIKNISSNVFANCTSLQTISLPICETIQSNAFYHCHSLKYVDLPNCKYISSNGFINCSSISYINLPVCSNIGFSAFQYGCYDLESMSLPILAYLGGSAFAYTNPNNTLLSVLDIPNLVYAWSYALGNFASVKKINFPIISGGQFKATIMSGGPLLEEVSFGNRIYFVPTYPANTFNNMTSGSIYVDAAMYDQWVSATGWASLSSMFVSFGDASEPMVSYSDGVLSGKTWAIYSNVSNNAYMGGTTPSQVTAIDLPECRYIGQYGFKQYYNVTSISLPKCEFIDLLAFQECNKFESINLTKCRYIGSSAFKYCTSMTAITLGESIVCVLDNYVFSGTKIESGTGSIYVPASLVDSYKSATNWSNYSSQIFPIPE